MENKEAIYTAEIIPLLKQVFDICKANGIAYQASFCLEKAASHDVIASSVFFNGKENTPTQMMIADQVISAEIGVGFFGMLAAAIHHKGIPNIVIEAGEMPGSVVH